MISEGSGKLSVNEKYQGYSSERHLPQALITIWLQLGKPEIEAGGSQNL